MNTRSFIVAALISGVVIGLLANLPILNIMNCFLCLWVWVGGILSVILYNRYQKDGPGLSAAQGAGLGAVAGLIGAFIGFPVNLLTSFISNPIFRNISEYFNVQGDLPIFETDFTSALIGALFFLILDGVLYPLFGALSGLIAASISGKKPQA